MDNPFDEMRRAVQVARDTQRAVKSQAGSMACLLVGHLRGIDPWVLSDLKRELRDYNIHTGRWNK